MGQTNIITIILCYSKLEISTYNIFRTFGITNVPEEFIRQCCRNKDNKMVRFIKNMFYSSKQYMSNIISPLIGHENDIDILKWLKKNGCLMQYCSYGFVDRISEKRID